MCNVMKQFSLLVFVVGIIVVYLRAGEQEKREAEDQKEQAGTEAHFHGLDIYLWDMGVPVSFSINYNYV